ncbi:MAG: TetR/AcrR family transcriptional regulator [Candidatus Fermentibacteraceae bacterium]|nr:TetR/AcrR family transcriptional regulator [Candidatus Fermentibacteraceae bacterium]MBN2609427.1 TetR/AcrR family transcriptional regulator [Candidatus Fermentibacteraceae bacterium]
MDTRLIIMDAAEDVFVDRGFSGSSIKSIAERAGVSKSLLYHYFPSKKDLWEEVIHRRVFQSKLPEKLIETVSSVVDGGIEAFREGGKHTTYFEFMRDNPQFVRMLAWLNAEKAFPCDLPPGIREGVLGKLESLQKKGILRDDIDPRIFVICFMAVSEMWFMSKDRISAWLGEDVDADEMSREYIDAVGKILTEGMVGGR